jgi:hypothetical protein
MPPEFRGLGLDVRPARPPARLLKKHCMAYEQFVANVAETAEFANKHNLPWCVSECTWGAWEDEDRAALLPGLEEFLKIGAGVIPYIL